MPTSSRSISQANLQAIIAVREELERIEGALTEKLKSGAAIDPGPLTAEVVDGKLIVVNGLKP